MIVPFRENPAHPDASTPVVPSIESVHGEARSDLAWWAPTNADLEAWRLEHEERVARRIRPGFYVK